jgi:internalin A
MAPDQRQDPRLHDTRVLNPGWVTGGVCAVVRSSTARERNGLISVTEMPQIILDAEMAGVVRKEDYPPDTHGFILDLMKAFQLCYSADDEEGGPTKFLVPELLPEFEPKLNGLYSTAVSLRSASPWAGP